MEAALAIIGVTLLQIMLNLGVLIGLGYAGYRALRWVSRTVLSSREERFGY